MAVSGLTKTDFSLQGSFFFQKCFQTVTYFLWTYQVANKDSIGATAVCVATAGLDDLLD